MPDSPPPETLAWLRQSAAVDGAAYSQVLLHLLDRVEALEVAQQQPADHVPGVTKMVPTPEAAPVATDEKLQEVFAQSPGTIAEGWRGIYNLGRKHGPAQPPAAQPAPVAAPAGGLVERVESCAGGDARAAIREVAAWFRTERDSPETAAALEDEAGR
jgi:hypothetical protein